MAQLYFKEKYFLVGIDEAGRGPLAGPLAVGACMAEVGLVERLEGFFSDGKVKDSKKLSPKRREEIFEAIVRAKSKQKISYTVSFSSPKLIDEKGLTYAIDFALADCLKSLNAKTDNCQILLDGGLKAPKEFKNQKTMIKGDEKEAIIALTSIVAKVSRDRKMLLLHKKYPHYGFAAHKGYGTKLHYERLKQYGPSPLHRKSFLKNLINAEGRPQTEPIRSIHK